MYRGGTKSFLALTIGLIFFFFAQGASAQNKSVSVEFFWGDGCPHCTKVEPIVNNLEIQYPQIKFIRYEIYHDQNNGMLLLQRYQTYNVPPNERGIPAVFIDGSYFIGDQPIIDNLEKAIQEKLPATLPTSKLLPEANLWQKTSSTDAQIDSALPDISRDTSPPQNEQTKEIWKQPASTTHNTVKALAATHPYSLWAITGAALVDSINPCAIAVILILLTALMMGAGGKRRALWGGLAFTASIYISYFLFGLGLLQAINTTGLGRWVPGIVGIIAIAIGLANIKDYFRYGGGGFVMEIPRKWRPTLKKILNGVTSPAGAFVSGFVVTLFELPCTGGPYFFVLGLLSQSRTTTEILPVLFYYNLVFVLPLLLIVFAVYFGVSSVQRAEQWKDRNLRVLHLVGGLIMLALGVWIIFW